MGSDMLTRHEAEVRAWALARLIHADTLAKHAIPLVCAITIALFAGLFLSWIAL
jgi:hypothetical protein